MWKGVMSWTVSWRKNKNTKGGFSTTLDIQSPCQMMSKGCTITSSARYLCSITILSFGDWIPRAKWRWIVFRLSDPFFLHLLRMILASFHTSKVKVFAIQMKTLEDGRKVWNPFPSSDLPFIHLTSSTQKPVAVAAITANCAACFWDGKGGNQKSICLNPCNNGKLYSGIGVAGGIPVANRSANTLSRTSQVIFFCMMAVSCFLWYKCPSTNKNTCNLYLKSSYVRAASDCGAKHGCNVFQKVTPLEPYWNPQRHWVDLNPFADWFFKKNPRK